MMNAHVAAKQESSPTKNATFQQLLPLSDKRKFISSSITRNETASLDRPPDAIGMQSGSTTTQFNFGSINIINNIQTKPALSNPGDTFEQEADRTAERLISMSPLTCNACSSTIASSSSTSSYQDNETFNRKCVGCQMQDKEEEEQEKIQISRKASIKDSNNTTVSDNAAEGINYALNSSSSPLEESTRVFMESRFGHDFSNVRIHTDEKAARSAKSVNALAYTLRNDVVFGKGQYAPGTSEGKKLLAHELTHVIQQNSNRSLAKSLQRQGVHEKSNAAGGAAAAGESPVPESKYVKESGCDAASASNLIGNDNIKEAMKNGLKAGGEKREVAYFIVQKPDCSIEDKLAGFGGATEVKVPPLPDGRYEGNLVVGFFHNHPPLDEGIPGPSPIDLQNSRLHLLGNEAYVIDHMYIYVIYRDGSWRTLGTTAEILGLTPKEAQEYGVQQKTGVPKPGLGELTHCVRSTNAAGLRSALTGNNLSVVEFSMNDCPPCEDLKQVLERICEPISLDMYNKEGLWKKPEEQKEPHTPRPWVLFYKANFQEEPELEKQYSLKGGSAPQLLIFRGSHEVLRAKFEGNWPAVEQELHSEIQRLVIGEDDKAKALHRDILLIDIGTSLSGPTSVILTPTYRRILAAWFDNKLQLGLDIGAKIKLGEGESEGETPPEAPPIQGGTRFSFEPKLNLTYNLTEAERGPFIEGAAGTSIGQVIPEEEAIRIGALLRGGLGYSFGEKRIGIYTDVIVSESRRIPVLQNIFAGFGFQF